MSPLDSLQTLNKFLIWRPTHSLEHWKDEPSNTKELVHDPLIII